jgi:hypothetical protein
MTLRSAGADPLMVLLEVWTYTPKASPAATSPVGSTPIKFPATVLPPLVKRSMPQGQRAL